MSVMGAQREGLSWEKEQCICRQGMGKSSLYLKTFFYLYINNIWIHLYYKNAHGKVRTIVPTAYHPQRKKSRVSGMCPSDLFYAVTQGLLWTRPRAELRIRFGAWAWSSQSTES